MAIDDFSTPNERLKNLEQLMPGMHPMVYVLGERLAERVDGDTLSYQFFDEADRLIRSFAADAPQVYDASELRLMSCYVGEIAQHAYSKAFANGVLERSEFFISGR